MDMDIYVNIYCNNSLDFQTIRCDLWLDYQSWVQFIHIIILCVYMYIMYIHMYVYISYHIISYHIISYHIISYHSNPLRATCEAWNTLKRLDHTHARPHNLSWARLLRLIPPAVVSKPLGNTEMVERWLGLSPCPGCNRHHQDDIMFVGSGIPKYKL